MDAPLLNPPSFLPCRAKVTNHNSGSVTIALKFLVQVQVVNEDKKCLIALLVLQIDLTVQAVSKISLALKIRVGSGQGWVKVPHLRN